MLRVKLGEISKVFNGYAFKSSEYTNDGYQVIRIANVQDGYISNESPKYITLKNNFHERFILKENDLLISLTGNVGRVGLVIKENLPAVLNQRVAKIIVDTNKILVPYLFYFFRNPVVQSQLIANGKGIAQKNIGSTDIENLLILLPSLNEQKRIVSVLDQADELRRKRKQAMELLDECVKAVFYDMFGDPVKNAKNFKKEHLGLISKISTGSTPNRDIKEYYNGEIPWVKTTEVNGNIIMTTEETITKKGLENSSCKIFPKDSIILAMYGQGKTRGRVGVLGIDASTNQACAVILPNSRYNTSFLFFLLHLQYQNLRNLGRGGNQPNLNLSILNNFPVIFPNLAMQSEFSNFYIEVNLIKQKMYEQSKELDNQFNVLMQKAFKGEL